MENYILARKEYCKQKKILRKRIYAYMVETLKKPEILSGILTGLFILCLTIAVIILNMTVFSTDVDMRGVTTSALLLIIIAIVDSQRRR